MSEREQTNFLPAYLITGDDALKRRVVLERLQDRLGQGGDIAFNSETIDAGATTGEHIVNACRTLPFASDKRLVVVSDANKLKKADAEEVAAYLSSPADTAVLALVAEKMEKSSKLYKAVAALGKSAVIDCSMPKSYKMREFVQDMARRTYGLRVDDDAADKLLEFVGSDTVRIDSELRKISFSHDAQTPVELQDIVALVSRTAEAKPWDFVDAFSERDIAKSLACYRTMRSSTPHALLAMCVTRLRELACTLSLRERGATSADAIASELGLPSWKVKNYGRYAANFAPSEVRRAIVSSGETERAMKSGADPDAAFITWVIETLKR